MWHLWRYVQWCKRQCIRHVTGLLNEKENGTQREWKISFAPDKNPPPLDWIWNWSVKRGYREFLSELLLVMWVCRMNILLSDMFNYLTLSGVCPRCFTSSTDPVNWRLSVGGHSGSRVKKTRPLNIRVNYCSMLTHKRNLTWVVGRPTL